MSFFSALFRRPSSTLIALIDIGATSIGGAYVEYKEGAKPLIHYTLRMPIEIRGKEPHEQALLRTLEAVGTQCIREGAPTLVRATGRGSASAIFVSVDAPWQELRVRTEHIKRKDSFVFTKDFVTSVLENTRAPLVEKLVADESIIGTILNGYGTNDPYGKTANRASLIILTSFIEADVSKGITKVLRSLFHTKHILLIAGTSLRYQGVRSAFPHEESALILDVTETLTSIALVRRGLLVAVTELSNATGSQEWVAAVTGEFGKLAERYPLPRTIFLLSRESDAGTLQKTLSEAKLGGLWLSENPPAIIPVLASHLTELVQQTATTPPDLILFLMAEEYRERVLVAD